MGHLILAAALLVTGLLVWVRFRAGRATAVLALLAAWAFVAFLVVQYGFRLNLPVVLPTPGFLEAGTGRILDMGSGSGRATVMALTERPLAQVVALDNWSADYIEGNSPRLLLDNAAVAGARDRVEAVTGDMRSMPFEDESFDAIVSTYAIDHLDSEGATKALAEARRVLVPGGSFLLMVVNHDGWALFAYGPMAMMHGSHDVREKWATDLLEAGFEIVQRGQLPGTAYYLAAKPAAPGGGVGPTADSGNGGQRLEQQ
jgi:SAM-dependent methyltransferase